MTTRKPLISGNWKMNYTHLDAIAVVQKLAYTLLPADYDRADVSVHPSFTALRSVQTMLDADGIPIALGAQDVHPADSGAFTGEVSPPMLAKLNVRYVIVGHSERRTLFGMTDATVAATLRAVLRHEMTPIVCVGETEEERAAGRTESRLEEQVLAALEGLSPELTGGLVVAYEPLWAIGTGQSASAMDAEDACVFIRSLVEKLAGGPAAGTVRIQYGGSVQGENAAELLAEPDVDGLLVGGASLNAAAFLDIIRAGGAC